MKWVAMLKALPPWRQAVYWIAVVGLFAMLIWDIVDKSAQFTMNAYGVTIEK